MPPRPIGAPTPAPSAASTRRCIALLIFAAVLVANYYFALVSTADERTNSPLSALSAANTPPQPTKRLDVAQLAALAEAQRAPIVPHRGAAPEPAAWAQPAATTATPPAAATPSAAAQLERIKAAPRSGGYGTLDERKCGSSAHPDVERRQLLHLLPPSSSTVPAELGAALRAVLDAAELEKPTVGGRRAVLLTAAAAGEEEQLRAFAATAAALRVPALALVAPAVAAAAAELPIVSVAVGAPNVAVAKWRAIGALVGGGVGVLFAEVGAVLAAPPFAALHGDSDFEAATTAWETEDAWGHVMGSDDPSMGWSRYCESMRIARLHPGLFYAHPTEEARAVALRMAAALEPLTAAAAAAAAAAADADAEGGALSDELLAPAFDTTTRVGAKVRVIDQGCWMPPRVAAAMLGGGGGGRAPKPAALLVPPGQGAAARQAQASDLYHFRTNGVQTSAWAPARLPRKWELERRRIDPLMGHALMGHGSQKTNGTRALVLRSKCAKQPIARGLGAGGARRLNYLAKEGEAWPTNCETYPEICETVKSVAKERAVLAAVSNSNILHMLGQFVDIVQKVGVSNFLVVAIDQRTADFLKGKKCAHYVRKLRTRTGSTDNHATSGLKFQILYEMLSVGVSVLLSDVDVVITQDPFVALYRDTDVEGMSDGWDDDAAYGHTYELPLPAGSTPSGAAAPARWLRLVARNSGLFYLAATHECLRLMKVLAARMAAEAVWDQSAYNMEIFRPAYGEKAAAGVSVRTMNYLCFLNTKTLFKYMRYDAALGAAASHTPVTAHVNYHPEKEARMVSIIQFYFHGDTAALNRWNGGEGQRTGGCRGKVGVATNDMPPLTADAQAAHAVAKRVGTQGAWTWSGRGPVRFDGGGALASPWGAGTWGAVPSQWRKDSLHVIVGGETYLLMFLSEKWAFVAVRCSDEHVSYGQLERYPDVPQDRLF